MLEEQLRTVPEKVVNSQLVQPEKPSRCHGVESFAAHRYVNVGDRYLNLEMLAKDPQIGQAAEEIIDIADRYPTWSRSYWGLVRPIVPIADSIKTDQQAVVYLASVLQRREQFIERIMGRGGSTSFKLSLGNINPFELAVSDIIYPGINRLYLLDGSIYEKGIRVTLGHLDFDYDCEDRTTLLVNAIQDEAIAVDYRGDCWYLDSDLVYDGRNQRNIYTIASKGQRKIRDAMKIGRPLGEDIYEPETPGVEELMIYGALEVLVRAGILDQDAKVMIPRSEVTAWGGLSTDFACGSGHGTEVARNKTLAEAISKLPVSLQKRLKHRFADRCESNYSSKSYGEMFQLCDKLCFIAEDEEDFPKIFVGSPKKHLVGLDLFLAGLMVEEIPDQYKPTHEELEDYGFYNEAYRMANFGEFMMNMAIRTSAYKRTFHAYRTAFSDVKSEDIGYGRKIARQDLLGLPFVEKIRIEPITR